MEPLCIVCAYKRRRSFRFRLKTKTQKLTNDLDKATNAHQSHVDRINQLEREVEAGRLQATAGESFVINLGHSIESYLSFRFL